MKLRLPLAAVLAATALTFAACGDDDESDSGGGGGGEASQPATLSLTATESGQDAKLAGPGSVEAGAVRVELKNDGKRDHTAQLLRLDEGHTAEEALEAGNAWGEDGKEALPEWIHLEGGVGAVKGGETGSATVELEAGKYVAFDLESDSPVFAEFEVTGEGGAELPAGDGTITAKEYSFTADGLKAGKNTIVLDNAGKEPHHAVGLPLRGDATAEDVERFFRTEKGEPPVDEANAFDTTVIDGGTRQAVDVELKAGRYALICFIPDRAGGPPHVAKGMISEVEVR